VFGQFLRLIARHEFDTLATSHHQGAPLRRMTRFSQFVALATAHLARRHSLRDVVANLAAQGPRLYHFMCPHRGGIAFQLLSGADGETAAECLNCGRTSTFEQSMLAAPAEPTEPSAHLTGSASLPPPRAGQPTGRLTDAMKFRCPYCLHMRFQMVPGRIDEARC
jgi:hypothetical protein